MAFYVTDLRDIHYKYIWCPRLPDRRLGHRLSLHETGNDGTDHFCGQYFSGYCFKEPGRGTISSVSAYAYLLSLSGFWADRQTPALVSITGRLAKFVAQVKALGLIPKESVFDIGGCGRPNENRFHARRVCRRPNTSSTGIPTGPSRSSSSSRRSSSSRCASVSGTAFGVDERLSQRFSRS